MSDGRTGAAALSRRAWGVALALSVALLGASSGHAESLQQQIPNLFGGTLATSISPRDLADAQRPLVADRFRGLSAALAAARSQAPIPSASGAFSFLFEPEFDAYVRVTQSLGPSFAERAQTIGKGAISVITSYSRVDFDTLDGDSLGNLRSSQPALSDSFLQQLPAGDRARARDNRLDTEIDMRLSFDLLFLAAAYGITDTIDVSAALSINQARLRGHAKAVITDPNGNGGVYFSAAQPGVVVGGSDAECQEDFRCATDKFSASAFGTGDVFLRGKWRFYSGEWIDLASAVAVTIPTGNADDFLGFHDPTLTPWFIASKSWGRLSPHLNLGYSLRTGDDVSQAQWVAGADVRASNWLSLAGDFLGYHDDKRDGVNDDIVQSAVGFKLNPFGQFVLAANAQFPLNRDGVRADVIYSTQLEYTF